MCIKLVKMCLIYQICWIYGQGGHAWCLRSSSSSPDAVVISAECSIPISSGWCLCRLLYDGWLIWKFSNCVTLWQTDASQSNVSTFCLPAPVSARPPSDFSPFNTGCPRPGTPEVMYAEKDNNDRRDLIEEILHNFSNFLLNHNTTVS